MNETNKKRFEELYKLYYTVLCEELLRHSFGDLRTPNYHFKDFVEMMEDEAHSIKVREGY